MLSRSTAVQGDGEAPSAALFDQRDAAAEAAEDLGELHADVAAAQHDEVLGQVIDAGHPAWPAPTTMASNCLDMSPPWRGVRCERGK